MKQLPRLTPENIHRLPANVQRPNYDRAHIKPGILHLGLGAFHRAHQAVYTDTALALHGGNWGIVGASLRSEQVAGQLNPQGGLYTLCCEDGQHRQQRLIAAVQRVIAAPRDPGVLTSTIADPAIKVITLTITEKGYCLGADGWSLDTASQAVQDDLAHPEAATSAIGILARGLQQRQANGGAPLSIISCDNLSDNGRRMQRVLGEFVERSSPRLLPWLERSIRFPCSMVDRIVPASSEESLQRQAAQLGLRDEAAVFTEPFTQWVIEDDFANDVPDWAGAGARLVDDIRGYETVKLRILNAAHSAIAYTGLLCGRETVAEVMADPELRRAVENLMKTELASTVEAPPGFQLEPYCDQLLIRFDNPRLRHRCAQIAMDGSEKIRQRWLPTLDRLPEASRLLKFFTLWCFLVLETEQPLQDPRREALLTLRASKDSLPARLKQLLDCLGIDPSRDSRWQGRQQKIEEGFAIIERHGVRDSLTISS
jgi:fructuronate reductase